MGSWSVYCSISNIAITSGQKCVLLPLRKATEMNSYSPYLPATLPIFGEYDDYGGLENIVKNDNTELIEKHFGISIEDFVKIFVDWKTYEREECKEIIEKCKNFNEIEKWTFMFINKKVYDFMSTYVENNRKGNLPFGDKGLLEYLDFNYVGIDENNPTYDPNRFNKVWEYQGRHFYSDGDTLSVMGKRKNSDFIMYFNSENCEENSLLTFVKLPEHKLWIGEKASHQIHEVLSPKKRKELLAWIISQKYYSASDDNFDSLFDLLKDKLKDSDPKAWAEFIEERNAPKTIADKYIKNINIFGNGLSELVNISCNFNCMSGYYKPFVMYLTPQCGEHKDHQVLLDKFSEINKEIMKERGYDEE